MDTRQRLGLLVVCVGLAGAVTVGAQTVANPSFESGLGSEWTLWTGAGSNGDWPERDWAGSGLPHGSWSLGLKGIGSGGKGVFQYIGGGWQDNHNYRVTVYAKNIFNTNLKYAVGYRLGQGGAGDAGSATYSGDVVHPSSWTQAAVEFTYSGGAGATLYLKAVNDGHSERAGFDLVQITDLGAAGPTNTPTRTPTNTPTSPGAPTSTPTNTPASGGTPMDADPGLVWLDDGLNEFTGTVARRWSTWYQGTGDREWNIVAGETGWAQEVKKSNVQVGIYRADRGFIAGDRYRVAVRAKKTSGNGTPAVSVGVHTAGDTDPSGVSWGTPVSVSTVGQWVDVSVEVTASAWEETIFLRADFTGVYDGGVAFDNVSLELLVTPGQPTRTPKPWMLTGEPPEQPAHIYAIHDSGAEHLFNAKNRKGWVVHALAIGDNPNDTSGKRFTEWVDGHGVVARISYDYGHTLPVPDRFDEFAQRCAHFVENSLGCGIWSIANEPGLETAGGVPLTPQLYADAYLQCRSAIKAAVPDAVVITGGFVQGDFDFFEATMDLIEGNCDGIAIHSYTNANYWNESSFNLYRQQLALVPQSMRNLPVYMTEAGNGATGPYPDADNDFIKQMWSNIHAWNHTAGNQPIRSCHFYRWLNSDQWGIETKQGMIDDFLTAMDFEYTWTDPGTPTATPTDTSAGGPTATPTATPTNTPTQGQGSGAIGAEDFDSLPSWDSEHNASWGGAATWTTLSGGASGNFLQAARSSQGSSVKVLVFAVPANTNVDVSAYLKCPSFAGGYWMEFACKPGTQTAANFDDSPGSWTMIKKFDSYGGANGNGNNWTLYSAEVNTGPSGTLSVGFKLGSSGGGGPTVGWDTVRIEDASSS